MRFYVCEVVVDLVMQPIPKSGYYNTNKFALIILNSLEEVIGKNGLKIVLTCAHLPDYIDNYPADNYNREFDFADFSSILQALEENYGKRGSRGLALRAGRAAFTDALRDYGALAGVGDQAFRVLPLGVKLRIGLPAMAKIFPQVSDQTSSVKEYEDEFVYSIHRCPVCWGRSGLDKPVCYVATGVLQAGLKWVSGGMEFSVHESKCIAMGDDVCDFVIKKSPIV